MKAPQEIIALVERFDQNLQAYQSGKYNETQLRREFIDPFFKALGWDVENTSGYAEAYKDVIHEDAIKIGSANKAPDYSFRVGGTRKFFVEAKKPSVNIAEDIGPAYQLRRYAWSAKLSLSILSDFEEFAVYDCRVKPDKADKASTARIIYLKYKEYLTRWEEIASIFSKEALMKGSFDKYAETTKTKRGTAGVDAAFLSEIDSWRQTLAQNIALRNLSLTQRELNFAVTKTIDRIIFLRICEDRGIEPYGRLMALQNGADVYLRLTKYFYDADDKYNSGLFHFKREKDRFEPPDDLTLTLSVDDKILKDIFKSLYYPESPYEFSVLPADILGQVYEQFLGKVIHLTPGHRARVEEKPEVRKAGGVYYTPTYIVDYIVKNTVGKLLEGKTPKAAKKLRILDPACGSGSFLIGAYQYLLDWHRDKYIEDGAEKHAKGKDPKLYQRIRNEWRLTTAERKRILLNNIYGVDIDPQAVEVTKLSLLLKVLEGESDETIKSAFRLFNERALPDLGNNIKCGNSLIGPDFYEGKQTSFLDTEEMQRVNAFDWEREFPEIFKAGGFDAVIGNPPYLNIDDVWGKGDIRLKTLKNMYPEIYNDKTDILFYFLLKAAVLSKNYVSFIISRAFLEAYKADRLRTWLLSNTVIQEIVDFQNYYIFKGVGITTSIIKLCKDKPPPYFDVYKLKNENQVDEEISYDLVNIKSNFEHYKVKQSDLSGASWTFVNQTDKDIIKKIDSLGVSIGDILLIGQGMQTGRNDVFGKRNIKELRQWNVLKSQYYKRASNSDIQRYSVRDRGEYLLYLENVEEFNTLTSGIQKHLKDNAEALKERAAFQRGNCLWWKYTWPLHKEFYSSPKIMCPYLSKYNRFAIDQSCEYIGLTDTTVLFENKQPENLHYLLGLLNSQLLTFRYKSIGKLKSGGVLEYFWNGVSKLPIRRIDFNKTDEKKMHDNMVQLVEQMLSLNKQLTEAKIDHDQTLIQRQIDATDNQIDKLVYELYDLTPEEIAIVEKSI